MSYILDTTKGNWKGMSGFLAGGLCLLCALWSYFRLPECKRKTYEELDFLCSRNLKAREFEKYQIDHEANVETKVLAAEHLE